MQQLNLLQSYIASHGGLKQEALFEAPFTSFSHERFFGIFHDQVITGELLGLLKPFFFTKEESDNKLKIL